MPWIRKLHHHKCVKPTQEELRQDHVSPGSIWECDYCRRQFMYLGHGDVYYDGVGPKFDPKWKEADVPYH